MRIDERQQELTKLLKEYAAAYYSLDSPLISDTEYDALYDELAALEQISGIVLAESPTIKVGGAIKQSFAPHRHLARLWSLDKVRSKNELLEWEARIRRLREDYITRTGFELPEPKFALEYKFDGLTINLTYENGYLVQAATRGNGETGESILQQVKTIANIPHRIPFTGRLEVQGEGYMRLSVLEDLNRILSEPLKNARNAAAGALRNLDPEITRSRKLNCFCYNIGYIEEKTLSSQEEMRAFMLENGLPLSDFYLESDILEDLFPHILDAEERRQLLDFQIDGMVIKVRQLELREMLGYTDKFPRWAVAYKFGAEEITTTVKAITWEVGRTGKLTPLAHLEPVELSGATIRRATLNNYNDILRKNVSIGSRVFIRRSNDVIPEILGSVQDNNVNTVIAKPTHCPSCNAHIEERGAHLFCPNSLSCKPQIAGRLVHFASRDAMDIEFFSHKTAELFVEELGISSIPQLYELTTDKLTGLERFGKKKAENLLQSINKSRDCALGSFLFALGIPNVGLKTARTLSEQFGSLEAVRNSDKDSLLQIADIGETIAQSIIDFFSDESISAQIDALLNHGVSPKHETGSNPGFLFGKIFVLTGTLSGISRREAEQLIISAGGKTASSVTKNTDYLLLGENPGSKLDKAEALGITKLNEAAFLALFTRGIK